MPKPKTNLGYSYGGRVEDYPDKSIRKFPGREKRKVRVDIHTWKGTSIGAMHYYASLDEEDNPFYDAKKNVWRTCWNDDSHKGLRFRDSFLSESEAIAWVNKTFKENFSRKTHKLVMGAYKTQRKKWFYRDGD